MNLKSKSLDLKEKQLKLCLPCFRNFRCDCGNSKFKNLECKLFPVSKH